MLLLAADPLDPSASRFAFVVKATLGLLALVAAILAVGRLRQLPRPATPMARRPWTKSEQWVYLAFVASVVALSFTALFSVLRFQAMHGWWLVAHIVSASVFVPVVTIMALFFSRRMGPPVASVDNRSASRSNLPVEPGSDPSLLIETRCSFSAVAYSLILVLSLVVIGTIWLGMFPLFGTLGLERLIDVHRYSGLGLFAATVLHGLLVATRATRQRSPRSP
jgi:hypothetical protein